MTVFTGAVPTKVIEQIVRSVDFTSWGKVFVCCSGSFRFDRAVLARHPGVTVHGNDVALLTCGIAALALGRRLDLRFTNRLAFVEDLVESGDLAGRVAAVMVAIEMAVHHGKNEFARAHFAHYQADFPRFLDSARLNVCAFAKTLHLTEFFAGDFRDHARRAIECGAGLAAFPPTYRGGYERLYRFVDENTDWSRPPYDVWDPKQLPAWIDEIDASGAPYCILTDREIVGREPLTVYRSVRNKPVYTYARQGRASVRSSSLIAKPFTYRAIDPAALKPQAKIDLAPCASQSIAFLKDRYLAKGIARHAAARTIWCWSTALWRADSSMRRPSGATTTGSTCFRISRSRVAAASRS